MRPTNTNNEPVAVLHVFSYFAPDFTGEGIYLAKLMRHLRTQGVSGDIVAAWSRGDAADVVEGASRVWHFGRGDRRPRAVNLHMLWWLILNVRRYQVVHFHSWVDRYLAVQIAAKIFRRTVVQSCTLDDGIGHFIGTYSAAKRPLIRRLIQLIDVMIAISPRLYADCISHLPPNRIELVAQGVDEKGHLDDLPRDALRARWGIPLDALVLLFVGGLCERKDVRFLVEMHAQVIERHPGAQLIVVGPDLEDDYANALRDLAARTCGQLVRFTGFMHDPDEAYQVADTFVFASRSEGFGNVIVEAMAHGLPVVSRRLVGVTDAIIDHESTGYLFDDAAQYMAAVRTLANRADLRTAIGRRARDHVRANFGLAPAAQRYAQIYRRLTSLTTNGANMT